MDGNEVGNRELGERPWKPWGEWLSPLAFCGEGGLMRAQKTRQTWMLLQSTPNLHASR